ncbi:MAG: hypothetical protein AAB513_02990 [Patescibacteria group bacterium]
MKKKSLSKKNKKGMSIDDLAVMVAKGFSDVGGEIAEIKSTMATKDDLKNFVTKSELKLEIKNLKDDIEVMVGKYIGSFRKDFDNLASRVRKLEEKVL